MFEDLQKAAEERIQILNNTVPGMIKKYTWDEEPVTFRNFITAKDHMNFPSYSERQYQVADFMLGTNPKKIFENANTLAVLEWGKGSGKDTISCHIILYVIHVLMCMRKPQDYFPGIGPTDTIDCINVAYSAAQATAVFFDKMKNNCLTWPWLKKNYPIKLSGKVVDPTEDMSYKNMVTINQNSIFFPKRVRAFSRHSEQESTEGLNILCFVADEISAFKDKTKTRNASKIYNMLDSSSSTRFGPHVKGFLLSYPRYKGDFIEKTYEWAKDKLHIYADLGATADIKPKECFSGKYFPYTLGGKTYQVPVEFKLHFDRDPGDACAKYLCIPPGAESPFIERPDLVDLCVDKRRLPLIEFEDYVEGHFVKKRIKKWNITYFIRHEFVITIDLGLRSDSAGFSMHHSEKLVLPDQTVDQHIIQDAVTAWKPDKQKGLIVDFQNVEDIVKEISQKLVILGVWFDQWNSAQMVQRLNSATIRCDTYQLNLQDYKNMKEKLYFGRIHLLMHQVMVDEIKSLEIFEGRKVDHPEGGGKDIADTVVGAIKVLVTPGGSIGPDEGEIVGDNISTMADEGEYVTSNNEITDGLHAKLP
jgi:hypothetical protein